MTGNATKVAEVEVEVAVAVVEVLNQLTVGLYKSRQLYPPLPPRCQ